VGTDLAIGDWPFFIFLADFGKFGFINEVLSAYRKHGEGLWSKASIEQQVESVRKMYRYVDEHLQGKYHDLIEALANRWAAYLTLDFRTPQLEEACAGAEAKVEELKRMRRADRAATAQRGETP
jgi:hypothetical protein